MPSFVWAILQRCGSFLKAFLEMRTNSHRRDGLTKELLTAAMELLLGITRGRRARLEGFPLPQRVTRLEGLEMVEWVMSLSDTLVNQCLNLQGGVALYGRLFPNGRG
mmetsp:Transcript_11410/g.26367  ORF Transcript_11410/g.26367 Transcript_11410/m.26367 type:complete len:107 (+) Transcript_11410:2645-2965(+)